ncbi:class I SAM-dependent DNA methyltransferase [Mangrovibacterium marinum]|uniref:class I SAM-dependent DNA methyltransferase n=1 Tax=Mangrovibacterium marinum TaxID=1639118 RepID=UPI002A189BD9|nr:class I SAM-dependent DNA methyltransferase [Mangrovibacterium marinum]
MTTKEEQIFLNELDKKLWTAADKLRSTLSAAEYKHAVLGLIFVKYVSDAFNKRRDELMANLTDPQHDYYLPKDDFDGDEEYQQELEAELEVRDYYTEKNVFWVPERSRWVNLENNAKVAKGDDLPWKVKNAKGEEVNEKMKSVGILIDNALEAIEKDNPKLKGILNKTYARLNLDDDKLGDLISLIGSIKLDHDSLSSKDILGHVYEYFLGQFASAEGKKGGQFYTPKSIVSLIVEMLQPYQGRVYDPAMGSGGFFVQSEKFIKEQQGKIDAISVYGQEYNHTTWQLAAMNMAIRGIDFNFGGQPADTLNNDLHPDLRADYIMANPPFNMKEWWTAKLENDVRWKYGTPPQGNANFAWLQHMIHHLSPSGSMALLLANGSMSSNTNNEGEIRKAILEADLVECMVALPGQLFTNTQIPACIWFLTKSKEAKNGKRARKGEVLFIDAREKGYMKDRVLRDFTTSDIKEIADTFHAWQSLSPSGETEEVYNDVPGFCKLVTLDEIRRNDYVLTPGRYVGTAEQEEDDEPFAEKMERLTADLKELFEEGNRLETEIKNQLGGLGYEL